MRTTIQTAAVAAALLLLSACQPTQDTAADLAALNEITNTFEAAYAAGDADAIAALYAEDAMVAAPNRPAVTGRDAIRDMLAADMEGAKAAGITLVVNDSTGGVSGDLGWNSGSWVAKDADGYDVDSGNYLSVSRKVDGQWLYIRDTWNSDRPVAAPPVEAPVEPAAAR